MVDDELVKRTALVIAAVALIGLSACTPEQIAAVVASQQAQKGPVRPAQMIYISMAYSAPFDARPGDTVNVIMEPDAADPRGWCDTRGGSLWMNPFTNILICEGVDF